MDRRRLVAFGVLLGLIAGWLLLRDRAGQRIGPPGDEPVAASRSAGPAAESAPAVQPASRPTSVRIAPTAFVESAPAGAAQEARRLVIRFETDDGSPPPANLSFNVRDDYGFWFAGKANGKGVGEVPKFPAIGGGWVHASGGGWVVVADERRVRRSFTVAPAGDVELTVPLRRMPPLPTPGTVEGIVTDASGRPVTGATVNSEMPVGKEHETATFADGRFRLTGIMPVTNCRVGAARGRGPLTWSERFVLGAGATVTGVTIIIGAKPDLIVAVVGLDGRPVPGVTVVVEDELAPAAEPVRTAAVTGSNGRAVFDSAPGVRVRVGIDAASVPDGVGLDEDDRYSLVLVGPREEPFVIQLRREIVLEGTVVGEDGSPVGGGMLRFWSKDRPVDVGRVVRDLAGGVPSPGPPPGLFPNAPPAPDVDRSVNVGSRGEFTLRVRSRHDYVVRDLRRLVRAEGADPKQEVFDPVAPGKLLPDAPNVVVVRRREE